MSRLIEFRRAEEALRQQLQQLEELKADSRLQRDLQFASKLRALLDEYGMSLSDIMAILDPDAVRLNLVERKLAGKKGRKRATKVYQNPHNNQVLQTKGGNHKILKSWKVEYGANTVEGWIV